MVLCPAGGYRALLAFNKAGNLFNKPRRFLRAFMRPGLYRSHTYNRLFSPKTDGVKLSCIQFAVVSIASFVSMTMTETFVLSEVLDAIIPLLYTGVLSSSVGYTCQIIAQKKADPVISSLILSLESVFAAIFGALILHESMSGREITGCAIMFVAIIIAQLPEKKNRRLTDGNIQ